MFERLRILLHNGKQYIPDPARAEVPGVFRGRPVISTEKADDDELVELCPTGAIASEEGLSIDLGKCCFCGECARKCPNKIRFTKDHKMATNVRERTNIFYEISQRPTSISTRAATASNSSPRRAMRTASW